jgi:hypothetical protein
MHAVKLVLFTTGAAFGHKFLLLDEHSRFRVLAFLAQQIFFNEPINPDD